MRGKHYASPYTPYEQAAFLSSDYAPAKRFEHGRPPLISKSEVEKAEARAMATGKKAKTTPPKTPPVKALAAAPTVKAKSKTDPPETRCKFVRKLFYVIRSFKKIGEYTGVDAVTAWRWYSGIEEVPQAEAIVVAKTLRGLESRTKSDTVKKLNLPVSFDRAVSKLVLYLIEHMGVTCTAEKVGVSKEEIFAWASRKKKLDPKSPVLPKMIALLDSLGQIEIARRKGQAAEFF